MIVMLGKCLLLGVVLLRPVGVLIKEEDLGRPPLNWRCSRDLGTLMFSLLENLSEFWHFKAKMVFFLYFWVVLWSLLFS